MGVGWRRFSEGIKQKTGTGGSLAPTSNVRNTTMQKEAADFLVQLRQMEKAIRTMKSANEGMLTVTKSVMTSPLPVVYEETAQAAGAEVRGTTPIGGSGFQADVISKATLDSGRRLEGEVLAPIARWQDVYHSLVIRMRGLEKQRLEVDSRRRTVAKLSAKVDGQRAKLGGSGIGGTKAEQKLESTIKLLQHKEGKLSVSTQTYQEQEALLHRDLSTLIKDTAWLRNYVSAALAVEGDALSASAAAFGPMPEAAPASGKIGMGAPEVPTTPVAALPAVVTTPTQAREPVEVRKTVSAEQVTNPFSQTI